MRLISRATLRRYIHAGHADAEQALIAWAVAVERAEWESMADIKVDFPSASVIDRARVVFNIKGNHYRVACKVWFPGKAVYIKFVGTHAEYDKVDMTTI